MSPVVGLIVPKKATTEIYTLSLHDALPISDGYRIGHAVPSGGLTAGSCGPFLFGSNSAQGPGRLHGSTKLAGEGHLWMMRGAPLISIVAQSVSMAVILPPEMRHSRPAPFR